MHHWTSFVHRCTFKLQWAYSPPLKRDASILFSFLKTQRRIVDALQIASTGVNNDNFLPFARPRFLSTRHWCGNTHRWRFSGQRKWDAYKRIALRRRCILKCLPVCSTRRAACQLQQSLRRGIGLTRLLARASNGWSGALVLELL